MFWVLFVRKNAINFSLVKWLPIIVVLKLICRAFLSKNFESINSRKVRKWSIFRVKIWVRFQQYICEAGAEVRPINIEVLLPRDVDFLAFGAVSLHSASAKFL